MTWGGYRAAPSPPPPSLETQSNFCSYFCCLFAKETLIKQGQTVLKLQIATFWDIYSPLARLYFIYRVNKKSGLAAFWPILVIFFSTRHGYQYYGKFYYFCNFFTLLRGSKENLDFLEKGNNFVTKKVQIMN